MAKIIIKDLADNTQIAGELLLKAASMRKTKTGKSYLDAMFTDGHNDINAKFWDCCTEYAPGVYTITAAVSSYNGARQLRLSELQAMFTSATDFAPTRDYNLDAAWEYIAKVATYVGPDLHAFIKELVLDKKELLMQTTAAIGMHHVQAGGLVQHMAETLYFAESLARDLEAVSTINLVNVNLVRAGAILHDIGKCSTYTLNTNAQFERTIEGAMYEHIVTGILTLDGSAAAKKFPSIALLLKHIIAAHHGKLEYGSAVYPATIEALIVSVADNLSATIDSITKVIEDTKPGEAFTPRIYTANNTAFMMPAEIRRLLSCDADNELEGEEQYE